MTWVVSGAAGFLGRGVVDLLKSTSREVIGVDVRERVGYVDKIWDVTFDGWGRAILDHGATNVVHFAGVNGTGRFYSEPQLTIETAVRSLLALQEAVHRKKMGTLIYASTSEIYGPAPRSFPTSEHEPAMVFFPGNPRNSYSVGKIFGETYCLTVLSQYFERVIVIRPHNIFGVDMGDYHVIPQIAAGLAKSGEYELQGTGKETRAFCHLNDFIRAILALINLGGTGVYNVGDPRNEVTIRRLLGKITECFSEPKRISFSGSSPAGSVNNRLPDITKLLALGFKPVENFDERLREVVKWYST